MTMDTKCDEISLISVAAVEPTSDAREAIVTMSLKGHTVAAKVRISGCYIALSKAARKSDVMYETAKAIQRQASYAGVKLEDFPPGLCAEIGRQVYQELGFT